MPHAQAKPMAPFRFRALLPVEHGSWVFLLLPALVALLVRPSLGGAGLVTASLAVFLARTPLQRWDRLLHGPRLVASVGLLASAALGGMVVAFRSAGSGPLAVLALGGLALGPALTGGARRALGPELLGACGSGALLPAMLLAGSATPQTAAVAFGTFLLVVLPPFLFVRRQVAWARGLTLPLGETMLLHGLHAAACGLTLAAWRLGWVGMPVPLWTAILWGRTLAVRGALPARKVGWLEAAAALVHLAVLASGLRAL